jgi:hypothetical protein
MEEDKLKDYLSFQLNRSVVSLYKKLFEIVEDMRHEHNTMLKKVEQETSEDFVKNIDYFNEDKYNYIRKKILDSGNDAIRTIETNFKSVKVTLK